MVRGLVQQQQIGRTHQRLPEIEPHPEPAGERCHGIALSMLGHAETREQRGGASARAVAVEYFVSMMQLGQTAAVP